MPHLLAQTPTELVWHSLTVDEALRFIDSTESGLIAQEATRRLEAYGANVLERQARFNCYGDSLTTRSSGCYWAAPSSL
jgi:hypothetical protein